MENLFKHCIVSFLIFLFPSLAFAQNPTPDVIDFVDASVVNQTLCVSSGYGQPVDLYQDGVADTYVVFSNLEGQMVFTPEGNGSAKELFFSFIDNNCGGSAPYFGKGRVLIRFVDMLAPGFVGNDPATWTYTKVPALDLATGHDFCADANDTNPYLQVRAYRNTGGGELIASSDGFSHSFSDPIGIGELFITSDFCENTLNDLILYDAEPGQGNNDPRPAVSILMDTSGSMNWSHEGNTNVPVEQRRITLAKNAVEPFLLLMNDHYDGVADFGVAAFPNQASGGCTANVERPMALVSNSAINDTINNVLPGLQVGGNTPLLAGIAEAAAMFSDQTERAIVLLSDGYHNCPGSASPGDTDVVNLISALNQDGVVLSAIGFGRPSDVDHPLLEAFSQQTSGEFYDVTEAGFDPFNWDPAVALQETYKNIAVDALGLESIVDPIDSIRPNEKRSHAISLSAYENKVTFFTSWACERAQVKVSLRDSHGKLVTSKTKGVRLHANKNYWLMTLDSQALANRVTSTPWLLQVESGDLCGSEKMSYQYSVLGQSDLKMQAIAHAEVFRPGVPVTLLAKLSSRDGAIKGQKVMVEVVGKREKDIQTWWLRDDGRKGDALANDGVYTFILEEGHKETGTYTYNFMVQGQDHRKQVFERYVRLKQSYGEWKKAEEPKLKIRSAK